MINMGSGISEWQLRGLRSTFYNMETGKCVLLFSLLISLFLSYFMENNNHFMNNMQSYRRKNEYIAYIGSLILILILLYGIVSNIKMIGQGYTSISNVIYEYSILIFVLVWYYSNDMNIDIFLKLYIIVFSLFFLLIGDRSSVFMFLVVYLIIYKYEYISIGKLLLLMILGIFLGNLIGILRTADQINVNLLENVIQKGLYVDTFSWSYYTGISLVALHFIEKNNGFLMLIDFLLSVFGIRSNKYSSLSNYVTVYPELFNRGGGMYGQYFYAMAGLMGVFISCIILFYIINKIFSSKKNYAILYVIVLTSMVFRWYLYSPITLYRTILLNFTIMIYLCDFFDRITRKIINKTYSRK